MGWFSTLSGGAAGMLVGGPIGAIIGAALGYGLGSDGDDEGPENEQERKQAVFFSTVFATMGYVAKADGRVSDQEIDLATDLMDEMDLDAEGREFAQNLFREGKSPHFPLNDVLEQFYRECWDDLDIRKFFLWILLHIAFADGRIDTGERNAVQHIASRIGVRPEELDELEAEMRAESEDASPECSRASLEDAYRVLGVEPGASSGEVKRAYHSRMKDYHPDVLASKGLPEEMIQFATQRTQEFSKAYDRIRQAQDF